MSKPLYLSNSQISTFTDCEQKWYIDKVLRLRPTYLGSALLLGSAIDNAVEAILITEDDYQKVFKETLENFEVNGKSKTLPKDILDIKLFASDLDAKLLAEREDELKAYCEKLEIEYIEPKVFMEYCKGKRKVKSELSEVEQKLFNFMGYQTLLVKGRLLMDELKIWIDENVSEVHSVQKKIEIENDNGDKFIGYLDFVVTLKNGKKVLMDLKTSSNPSLYYPEDAAATSMQLGIYSQEEDIKDVAYLVADKNIRVREPRVRLSYVDGVITEEHLDVVFGEIERVTETIKEKLEFGAGAFDKNKESCTNFGGCQYRDYCWKGSKKRLEEVK